MNTKVLCIAVLVFTILIFGANHYAARNELPQDPDYCKKCLCDVTLIAVLGSGSTTKNPKAKEEPSCSAVFRMGRYMGKEMRGLSVQRLYDQGPDNRWDLDACSPVIYCDTTAEVRLECRSKDGKAGTEVRAIPYGGNKCPMKCEYRGDLRVVDIKCDHWERPTPQPPVKAPSKPPAKKSGRGMLASMLFGSSWQGSSTVSSFVPAIYTEEAAGEQQAANEEANQIISDATRWWLIKGEAGIERGLLMVANGGEAEAQSFCTGDSVRVIGPGAITLPTCQTDSSGRWQGAYVRRLATGNSEPLNISLDLQKESGSLTTSDGVFNIVTVTRGAKIRLDAKGTVAGQPREFHLDGNLTKGDIVFDGYESGRRVTGFLRRLYVADSALPLAVVNQPYSFTLTAFSPGSQAITFRLATPAITHKEINWFTQAAELRGRNGERFTYLCPANGSPGGALYGTDTYSDDSSICKAAVHSGLITRQAGGVVTIQIKPIAAAYTATTRNGVSSDRYSFGTGKGSFVFVSGDDGERGRLPKGLSFDSQSGTFSGTPTELGSFDLSVVADDGTGNVFEQPLTITVKKLLVTNRLLPGGFVGQPYSTTLKVAGGQPPYRFSGSMPKGLQLDPISGEVSGKPSLPSSSASFEVTVHDSQNSSESQKVTLTIRGATILNSHFLPDGKVGVPYRMQFQAVGNLRPITWFGEGHSSGLVLNEGTGELSGTPTKAGNFFIEVEIGSGESPRKFALTIK